MKVYVVPGLLAVSTVAGLVLALVFDGASDVLGSALALAPAFVLVAYLGRATAPSRGARRRSPEA